MMIGNPLWKSEILSTAQKLFMSKGYEETSISNIMDEVGGVKGMLYRCFESKEELMQALGDMMFFENNPFDAVKERSDLNGLQKNSPSAFAKPIGHRA